MYTVFEDFMHYGTPRHSGRYPWGSGKDPYQRTKTFKSQYDKLKEQGLSEKEIANSLGLSVRGLRSKVSDAAASRRADRISQVVKLKEKGWSNVAIGKRLGMNESQVRSLIKQGESAKYKLNEVTKNALRDAVGTDSYIDIGVGVERHMGISRTRLLNAVSELKSEGYKVYYIDTTQVGTGKKTTVMTLVPPDAKYADVRNNRDKIVMPAAYSEDGGVTFSKIEAPRSISSDRVKIRYNEEGGIEKDGVIELRRGVEDLSLGNARYAQVRIAVDGTHYLKGMAMYSDDIPDGVDIVFNTNKHVGTAKMDVLKEMDNDAENPFGATIKGDDELLLTQRHYIDKDGNRQLSALNIVNEEGDWSKWSKTLSSQVLSKQPPSLAKKQLDLAYQAKNDEFEELSSLTNPIIRTKLLTQFADSCDSDSVDMKAAGMPRQASHVILPFNDIPETQIYAPKYENGERVVLIRYPHAGRFEMPELVVNNKNTIANKIIPNARDAVGINHKVAEQLSGADFDGDTVLVIPNNEGRIKTEKAIKELAAFDPKESYPGYKYMPKMSERTKQIQMGEVSNLITDMTIKGAPIDHIVRAVKHSMVVIDAKKHNLNWKQSMEDQGIGELKELYQGSSRSGASTLISRATSETRIPDRKEGVLKVDPVTGKSRRIYIDPDTGEKLYTPTGESYTFKRVNEKTGEVKTEVVPKMIKTTKLAATTDARTLSTGTQIEEVYASHSNKLKALGNKARKASLQSEEYQYDPEAAKTYKKEADSLNAKLDLAKRNAPLERKAQLVANKNIQLRIENNPDIADDKDKLKKIKYQELKKARDGIGAKKETIDITDKEWEAIQKRAISKTKLSEIIDNADLDKLKNLALPKEWKGLSPAKLQRAEALLDNGYTLAEAASQVGVSVSTLLKNI